ncbi:hypothetical protein [Mesobacillus zeae]|uniref:hypothetical protein n=1 Tax=Mesobacillus zeae TaxID=1917180 RepID=UPI00300AE2A0
MGVYIEGYVSKKAIKKILNNWHEVGARKRNYSEISHDNPIKDDGVCNGRINKIMIDQALKEIPNKKVQYCVYARWIHCIPVVRAAKTLGVSKPTFYSYCDQAVDFIYQEINGERAGVKELLELILE